MRSEGRFRVVENMDPDSFERLAREAQNHTMRRLELYQQLAHLHVSSDAELAAKHFRAKGDPSPEKT
jgi:hypothetical protein